MAITREMLEGLADERIEAIMTEYGKVVQQGQKASELQTQLDQLNKDLAKAQKTAGDVDGLRAQLQQAQTSLAETQKTYAIRSALAAHKPKDAEIVARLIDASKITIDENGSVIGLEDQIKPLRESQGYLFTDTPTPAGGNPNPSGTNEPFDMNAFLRGEIN